MNRFTQFMNGLFGWMGRGTNQAEGAQSSDPYTYSSPSAAPVNEDTALQISVVFACARLLAEVFASLPVGIYERNTPGRVATQLGNLNTILAMSPNQRMTPVEFYEAMQLNLVLHGNAYARIQRNGRGDVVGLWPLPARHVTPHLSDGEVVYHWYHDNNVSVIADRNILHVRLFGNGLMGMSPLSYARNSIGLSSAQEGYASKYFVSGGKPSGVLYTDAELTKTQREKARENFTEIVEQKEESRRLLVLPLGFKYQQIQISPADMQLLESRKHSSSDLCRFMGNIPGPLVGVMHESTVWGSGIEAMFLAWYRIGLNPYATRWEQAIEKKLMTPGQRLNSKVEFNFDALLRADSKTQADVIKSLVGGPVLTPDEGRARMNYPPVEGGGKLNPAPTHSKIDSQLEANAND